MNSENQLLAHIKEFRRKFYVNRIIRGSIGLLLIMSSIVFISVMGEGLLGFPAGVRTGMMVALGIIFAGVAGYFVVWPGIKLLNISKVLSDRDIAEMVRRHFPDIDDKLINLLELRSSTGEDNALAIAAVQRKTAELAPIRFSKAINLNVNLRFARYLAIPVLLFLLLWVIRPDVLSNGTKRLVNFNQEFLPPAPFFITVGNNPDELIAGQDFTLQANVGGNELPADLFLYLKKESESEYINYPMEKLRADEFEYQLSNVKENFNYYIGNQEVKSDIYGVDVLTRPSIRDFRVVVDYPGYSGIPDDTLAANIGDFKVLRGSEVKWLLNTQGSIKEARFLGRDTVDFAYDANSELYGHEQKVLASESYSIHLKSKRDIANIDTVKYHIDVIQDRHPSVYVNNQAQEFIADYTLFMPLDFEVSDDYGFSKLSLYYRFTKSDADNKVSPEYQQISLKINARELLQQKSMEVDLQTLGMEEGDMVDYYVKVWDNDMVAGPKATTSAIFKINYPSLNEQYEEVDEAHDDMEKELEDLLKDVENINETMEKFQNKMLDQKKLSYDDKRELEKMISQHEDVQERIEDLQEQFEETKEKLQNNEMISEKTLEKYEKLNELMERLNNDKLDEFMKKLEEEMDKMNPEEMRKMMEEMQFDEEDLEKALERTMELMKQLEIDHKAEELFQKLDNLQKKQDMLNEQMEDTKKGDKEKMDQLAEKQEQLKKEMEDIKKEMEELGDMKKDTQTPQENEMNELNQDAQETEQEMQNAGQQMQDQKKKDASESQKNASKKMEEMKEQLQSMMSQAGDQQDQQNLEDLRDLLENLLRLSFRQEDTRDEVKGLRHNDPALIAKELDQAQLLDDMYMVKDSLDELAKRVFQIEKFVTDESNTIIKSMKSAGEALDNKQVFRVTENQHQSMTSINNLANMLTDVMEQMQQQMQQNAKSGMNMCKKPGGGMPNMKDIGKQQGQLNQMMQQMMQGQGMDPKKLGEMAKMQEMLRKQLKEAHEKIQNGEDGALGNMGQVMKDMKDTEDELKNKILTEATMARQRKILQRLLDATKAVREKNEYEQKRKSRTGEDLERVSPDKLELEEYKNRLRQEMLKSNQLEYSSDFIILIEKYFKLLENSNE